MQSGKAIAVGLGGLAGALCTSWDITGSCGFTLFCTAGAAEGGTPRSSGVWNLVNTAMGSVGLLSLSNVVKCHCAL